MSVSVSPLQNLLDRLDGAKRLHDGSWMARCPAHADRTPSLHVSETEGGDVLLRCHAGCENAAVVAALDLTLRDLFADPRGRANGHAPAPESEIVYPYSDESGRILYEIVRIQYANGRKTFKCRSKRPDGRWSWEKPERPVPYRLHDVVGAPDGTTILIAEGEKDVDRLRSLGYVATTNPFGSGNWDFRFASYFRDRRCVVFPDNDDAGEKWAATVHDSLRLVTGDVTIVRLPDLPPKGDVSDWLDAGRGLDELGESFAAPAAAPPRSGLGVRSARSFGSEQDMNVAWLVNPYLAVDFITKIDGAPKTAGKTTFILAMAKAILTRQPFLGQPTNYAPVLLLSEQTAGTLRLQLEQAGLMERDDFYLATYNDLAPLPWGDIVRDAFGFAKANDVGLVIFDTLPAVAKVSSDNVQSQGVARETMDLIRAGMASHPCAAAILFHTRKSGGMVGEAGMGAQAWAGASDVILQITRSDATEPNVRKLDLLSRVPDSEPESFVAYESGGYTLIGSRRDLKRNDIAHALVDVLPNESRLALAIDDQKVKGSDGAVLGVTSGILTRLKDAGYGAGEKPLRAALESGVERGWLGKIGNGVRGNPDRYWIADAARFGNDATTDDVTRSPIQVGALDIWFAPDADES